MDNLTQKQRRLNMQNIRSSNTKIERIVFNALRKRKIYFIKNYAKAPGRPDIAVPSRKRAVFIDGDFWHGWQYPLWRHKLPKRYWREKIDYNRRRDRSNFAKLRRQNWKVLRIWEHQLQNDFDVSIRKIERFLK